MGRLDRLKEYQNPRHGPQGAARDAKNLAEWSARATAESKLAPRASDGLMKLPSTGRKPEVRDTSMSPRTSRNVDRVMRGDGDRNHVSDSDSPYLGSIKREA